MRLGIKIGGSYNMYVST